LQETQERNQKIVEVLKATIFRRYKLVYFILKWKASRFSGRATLFKRKHGVKRSSRCLQPIGNCVPT